MEYSVAELDGEQLDAAVALALGARMVGVDWQFPVESAACRLSEYPSDWRPSTRWDHAGPIIEREFIEIGYLGEGHGWQAALNPDALADFSIKWIDGPTPLIAAMRAYAASKFGETVELP